MPLGRIPAPTSQSSAGWIAINHYWVSGPKMVRKMPLSAANGPNFVHWSNVCLSMGLSHSSPPTSICSKTYFFIESGTFRWKKKLLKLKRNYSCARFILIRRVVFVLAWQCLAFALAAANFWYWSILILRHWLNVESMPWMGIFFHNLVVPICMFLLARSATLTINYGVNVKICIFMWNKVKFCRIMVWIGY